VGWLETTTANRNAWFCRLSGKTRVDIDGANGLNQDEYHENVPPEVDAVLLAVWRRVIKEGGSAELTLPEAAVLLGTSVQSVRRRIKKGKIQAFRDDRGRVRIRPSIPTTDETAESVSVASLWEELKLTKHELATAASEAENLRQELGVAHFQRREAEQEMESLQNETQELRDELETAQQALDHVQGELASMWRIMSSRRERGSQRFGATDGNEAFDLAPDRDRLESERSRIQTQITRVRELSRKRRWPWPQAS
jgi:excisionase family DNA binding protein